MKQLIVMRHAKSSWKEPGLQDHRRPLNKRGRRDSPRMGTLLRTLGWVPELVLSSDSMRTRQTYELMSEEWDEGWGEVRFVPEFYHGGTDEITTELMGLTGEGVDRVLVLGHNPGWEYFSYWLCGEHHEMTTANVALLVYEGDGDWVDAVQRQGLWRLEAFHRPKELVMPD